MSDPLADELDEEDLAAIEESEKQIERGEDLDWKEVSKELRRRYLHE
jgi:predicted transcriptional regulator